MRSYWKYGTLGALGVALAIGGGCTCPGSRVFAPWAGSSEYDGLFLATGVFQTLHWQFHDGEVLCCEFFDRVAAGGGNCFFDEEEDCDDFGRAVPSCFVCSAITFFGRQEGLFAGSRLGENGTDLTIDLAAKGTYGFAYYDEKGYTVVGFTTKRNREVLQVVVPGRLTGTYDIHGTDGKTMEPGVALRIEDKMYSTQSSERAALGEVTIDGNYPEVGDLMSGSLHVKLIGANGQTYTLAGEFKVPFLTRPAEITPEMTAQN